MEIPNNIKGAIAGAVAAIGVISGAPTTPVQAEVGGYSTELNDHDLGYSSGYGNYDFSYSDFNWDHFIYDSNFDDWYDSLPEDHPWKQEDNSQIVGKITEGTTLSKEEGEKLGDALKGGNK